MFRSGMRPYGRMCIDQGAQYMVYSPEAVGDESAASVANYTAKKFLPGPQGKSHH